MIPHFLDIFFKFLAPTMRIPFSNACDILVILVVMSNLRIRRKNRKNRRKSTPQGRENSSKSGDDRIGQVFSYVIAGSNGFQRVAVLRIGSVRKAAFHFLRRRIFRIFFNVLAPTVRLPLFKRSARAHTHKSGLIYAAALGRRKFNF